MAVKMAALALLVALSGAYGLLGARRLDMRVEELRELRLAMKLLEEQIHYLQTPLPEALQYCAERSRPPVEVLFRESAALLKQRRGRGLAEAWMSGLKRLEAGSCLKDEDIRVLRQSAERIGATGAAEQSQLLAWLDGELKRQQEAAESERASNRTLWSYGGFIAGALLALLIL